MNSEEILKRLTIEKLPVTTSYLAKIQKIPIGKAAEILNEFYVKYQHEGLTAKYSSCTKGTVSKSERSADWIVKIGDTGDRIFSVQVDNTSIANVLERCRLRWDTESMTTCEMFHTETYGSSKPIKAESIPENKPIVKKEVVKEVKPVIKSETKAAVKPETTNRPVYQSRKAASNPVSSTKSTSKPAYTSRKRVQPQEEKKPAEPIPKRSKTEPTPTEVSKDLEELMEDDFTDDDDEDGGDVQVSEYKYNDIDVSAPDEIAPSVDVIEEDEKQHQTPIERIATRDVTRNAEPSPKPVEEEVPDVETHTDADGYIVTKVNRKTPQPASAATTKKFSIETKPKTTSTGKPGSKQSTLASFFGKKK